MYAARSIIPARKRVAHCVEPIARRDHSADGRASGLYASPMPFARRTLARSRAVPAPSSPAQLSRAVRLARSAPLQSSALCHRVRVERPRVSIERVMSRRAGGCGRAGSRFAAGGDRVPSGQTPPHPSDIFNRKPLGSPRTLSTGSHALPRATGYACTCAYTSLLATPDDSR